MRMRKGYGINRVIRVGFLYVTGILFFMLPFYIFGPSESKGNKIEPLIIIKDANGPGLSFDGSRIIVGPEIGLTVVYDVNSGRKLGTYKIKNSGSEAISADGKRIRIFGGDGVYTTYQIDSGNLISQDDTSIHHAGRRIGRVGTAQIGRDN